MSAHTKEQKNSIKASLENKFLRTAMNNFAIAYRDGQKKVFSKLDKETLVDGISSIKQQSPSTPMPV